MLTNREKSTKKSHYYILVSFHRPQALFSESNVLSTEDKKWAPVPQTNLHCNSWAFATDAD